ncbi:MAG: hypothetical protein DWI22_04010 [Planctomycetota bacterium]|nr:MAG: hypothetical protein DWI22_04010 [Planctomycetota bacterium]
MDSLFQRFFVSDKLRSQHVLMVRRDTGPKKREVAKRPKNRFLQAVACVIRRNPFVFAAFWEIFLAKRHGIGVDAAWNAYFLRKMQLMDWQTSVTLLIFAIATGILLRRLGAFVSSGKIGSCGSCSGCGDTAKDTVPLQLVALGTGAVPSRIRANFGETADAGAEKTG